MNERLRPGERLLRKLGIQNPQDIDLEAIAWILGAVVRYRPLDMCEAMIVGGDQGAVITINSRAIATRQRFSIGHELGHWCHHRGQVLFCGASDIDNPSGVTRALEQEADRFASDLILPNFMVRPRIMKIGRPTLGAIREVAKEFRASDTATLFKVIDLDQFPIMVVCHNENGRRWFRRSKMIPDRWFPRSELDPESYAFDLAFGEDDELTYPRKVKAGSWFSFSGVDQFEVEEQSFRLPNDEVLTMLVLPDEGLDW